jgi:hypothetical protein
MNSMADQRDENRELLREWVARWQRAGAGLAEIHKRELQAIDTREAIRQIFGSSESLLRNQPRRTTSDLAEQQAWFAKLRLPR